MKNWHAFFELLKSPLEILVFSLFMAGLGTVLNNPFFGIASFYQNSYLISLGNMLIQMNRYAVVNFPILILIRLVVRKRSAAGTVIAALVGYIAFLTATMVIPFSDLPSVAFSSILGLNQNTLNHGVQYPLQTGVIGALLVVFVSLGIQKWQAKRKAVGVITSDTAMAAKTVLACFLLGVLTALGWPWVVRVIEKTISFISVDTSNPVNLSLYGMMDKILQELHLSAFIRQPFWYNTNGGSWINFAGGVVSGDANIWTAQLSNGSPVGMAGHFFTPYFIMNIFAIPAVIWTLYSVDSDKMAKRKRLLFCLFATLTSWLAGIALPFEWMLMFLAPLLFVFHVVMNGILYAFLQTMGLSLGFQTRESNVATALPGTLPEWISYSQNTSLQSKVLWLFLIGIVVGVIYVLVTRLYFNHFAIDLFKTGEKDKMVEAIIESVGGIGNIQLIFSSMQSLTLVLNDASLMNKEQLYEQGVCRIVEQPFGHVLYFGACSTILRKEIQKQMRGIQE